MKALLLTLFLILGCSHTQSNKEVVKDPLPSWSNTEVKKSIIQYVESVTVEGKSSFIPVKDRIAAFDNDGTLWAETPPNQILYITERAKEKGWLRKPLNQMSEKEILSLMLKTHTGMTTEKFQQDVAQFFEKEHHPTLNVPYSKTVYTPQIELLQYLKSKGFKIYISSGGTSEFMRVISEKYYGIPPEQVIGTSFHTKWLKDSNSLQQLPKLEIANDKEAKASSIERTIGKRPVFTAGNVRSGGDIYMLRYSQGSKYPSFQLLINHDDPEREFLYSEKDNISLNWANEYKWTVVSMKSDWLKVFPNQETHEQELKKIKSPIDRWLHE